VNFFVLAFAFQIQIRGLITRELVLPVLRILAASAVMAAAVWFVSSRMELLTVAGSHSVSLFVAQAFVPITAGIAVYFGVARLLGVEEARTLVRRFRR